MVMSMTHHGATKYEYDGDHILTCVDMKWLLFRGNIKLVQQYCYDVGSMDYIHTYFQYLIRVSHVIFL